jgi:hypothetical protein
MINESQPSLVFYQFPEEPVIERSRKLYLIPTTHGDSYDPDFAPIPSGLDELPELERWTLTFLIKTLEIIVGRRSLQQIARDTHRFTFNSIAARIGSFRELPKIRSIHRSQPIEGVIEMTVILLFKDRARALVARFEGVDRRWLCTELEML